MHGRFRRVALAVIAVVGGGDSAIVTCALAQIGIMGPRERSAFVSYGCWRRRLEAFARREIADLTNARAAVTLGEPQGGRDARFCGDSICGAVAPEKLGAGG
jgi:hypothetical protein